MPSSDEQLSTVVDPRMLHGIYTRSGVGIVAALAATLFSPEINVQNLLSVIYTRIPWVVHTTSFWLSNVDSLAISFDMYNVEI